MCGLRETLKRTIDSQGEEISADKHSDLHLYFTTFGAWPPGVGAPIGSIS